MLPSKGNTNATQIDHVVVSNFGIFCIETKAYQGGIFGRAKDRYWTQVTFSIIGKKYKSKIFNPLLQNYAHIKAIEELIGSQLKAPIISLIAFSRERKLKIYGTNSIVNFHTIMGKIQSYSKTVYSDKERDDIKHLLADANIVDDYLRSSYFEEIRAYKNNRQP